MQIIREVASPSEMIAAIEAYRAEQAALDAEEERLALEAAKTDPALQAWLDLAQREEALRTAARTQRPNKKPTA